MKQKENMLKTEMHDTRKDKAHAEKSTTLVSHKATFFLHMHMLNMCDFECVFVGNTSCNVCAQCIFYVLNALCASAFLLVVIVCHHHHYHMAFFLLPSSMHHQHHLLGQFLRQNIIFSIIIFYSQYSKYLNKYASDIQYT